MQSANMSNMNPLMSTTPTSRQGQMNNVSSSIPDYAKAMKNYKPNELFVGNLSYFCEEKDLFELFDQYGNVEDVRIIKNDSGTRSLMFGFVTMASVYEAREMEKLLNNHLFLGRRLRVAISERRYDFKPPSNDGIQMHVSFCSFFNFNDHIVRPTEAFLRKFFLQFGTVMDVSVKEYAIYREQNMQEGYGFVSFDSDECIMRAINACQNVIVHGIAIKCTITHQHNPHAKKTSNKKSTSPTAATALAMMGNKYSPASAQRNAFPNGSGMPSVNSNVSLVSSGPSLGPGITSNANNWNSRGFSSLNPPVPIPGQLILGGAGSHSSGLGMTSGGLPLGSPFSTDSTPVTSSLASMDSTSYDDSHQSASVLLSSAITPLSVFRANEMPPSVSGW